MNTSPKQSQLKTILAGFIGNVAEWYDFAVYAYFAAVIGPLFFPSDIRTPLSRCGSPRSDPDKQAPHQSTR